MRDDPGHVYLIHFDKPIGNDGNQGRNRAQHYWGHAAPGRLMNRLEAERTEEKRPNGSAAAILANLRERGIGWHVADLLPGSYADEQRYKRRGHTADHCPTCIAERGRQPSAKPDSRKEPSDMTTQAEPVQRVTQAQPAPRGTAHPDAPLAARGWRASERGIWTRGAAAALPHPETRREAELEAGG